MVFLELIIFAYTLWLGVYLLVREPHDLRLRYAGLGLIAYALMVSTLPFAENPLGRQLQNGLIFVPAVFWLGAIVALLPEENQLREWLRPFLRYGLPWAAALVSVLGLMIAGTAAFWLLASLVILILFLSVVVAAVALGQAVKPVTQARRLVLLITLFFALGSGLLLLPVDIQWLPQEWIVLALSLDLEVLGLMILWLDAYEQGEVFRRDVLRSFLGAGVAAVVFGGQVFLMQGAAGRSAADNVLLFSVSGTAVLAAVMLRPMATLLDRLVYPTRIVQARDELRAAEEAISRRPETVQLEEMSEDEFRKLTRRALSHLQDPARLAASPLNYLPQIDERLDGDSVEEEILGRTNALRELLIEQITRLKPQDGQSFAPTDAWRYYNALYFPYVVGLKPYSRRAWHEHLNSAEREALEWFRAQVPERTLYNWQNKGAELIAQQLRNGQWSIINGQ